MIARVTLRRAVAAITIAGALATGCARAAATSSPSADRGTGGDERAELEVAGDPFESAERELDAHAALEMDRWAARFARYARGGWQVPAEIPREELEQLSTVVEVDFDAERRPVGYRIVRPSGDARYDAALAAHLGRLIAAGEPFPEPPPGRRPPRVLPLRFRGMRGR